MSRRLTELLVTRGRTAYLVAVACATVALGIAALGVTTEQDNASMTSLDAEDRAVAAEMHRVFGDDEDLVVCVTSPRLLAPASLAAIDRLTKRIAALDGVRRVYSLTNAIELAPSRYGATERPLLERPLDRPDAETRAAAALARNPELTGFLISRDGQSAGLLVELESRPDDRLYRAAIITELGTLARQLEAAGVELHFTGIAAQKSEVTRLLERDQRVLIPASVCVLAVVLFGFFRSFPGVALPLAVTFVSLVFTLGVYVLCGLQLNTMTSLLPPVLMVLSVSTSVHLVDAWRRSPLGDRIPAILATIEELRLPCTFTSLTTAFGLASLSLSATPAVRIFGTFAALGVVISLGVALTLIPVGLSFLPRPAPPAAPRGGATERLLAFTARAACRRPLAIAGVSLALTALSIPGIARIENNTDLVRFLKSDNRLYRDTLYIDAKLAGTQTFELLLSRRDGRPLESVDATSRLARFRDALLARDEVTDVQSVLSLISAAHRAQTDGRGSVVPTDREALLASFDLLDAAGDEDLVRRLISPDFRTARVRVQLHAIGSARAAPLEDAILADAHSIFGDAYRWEATGSFHEVVRDSNRLVASQVESFSLALLLVMLAIGVLFRSFTWMALSLVPNVMPVLWTGGLMGLFSIDLSTGTAMIAAVVIGIAVDDTIHYLSRVRREGLVPVADAIHRTTATTGRALVISSVVLVVGFWVGALGSFKPTIYFSLLTGITMISALACDLLVLPASLVLFDRVRGGRGRA